MEKLVAQLQYHVTVIVNQLIQFQNVHEVFFVLIQMMFEDDFYFNFCLV